MPDPADSPLTLVNTARLSDLMEAVTARFATREGFSIATLNLDHAVKLKQDPGFRAAYVRQTFVVSDGNPITWLRRLMGEPVELIPGSELIHPLAGLAAEMDVPVALLGATDNTLSIAADRLTARFPGLRVVAQIAPAMGFEPESDAAEAILKAIADSGAGLCFLALGAPKQERLAAFARDIVPGCGFVSIGAGLDFIAGTQTRAPVWMQKIAMEWFWRMASNPRRLVLRYARCFAILPGLTRSALRASEKDTTKTTSERGGT